MTLRSLTYPGFLHIRTHFAGQLVPPNRSPPNDVHSSLPSRPRANKPMVRYAMLRWRITVRLQNGFVGRVRQPSDLRLNSASVEPVLHIGCVDVHQWISALLLTATRILVSSVGLSMASGPRSFRQWPLISGTWHCLLNTTRGYMGERQQHSSGEVRPN